jgi:rhodanese-related sulfurtransferase
MAVQPDECERIDAVDVARRMRSGEPLLLVCAYEADVAWRKYGLVGAIPRSELEDHLDDLQPGGLVVLYCRCPREKTATEAATALAERGFDRVRVLAGGYDAALEAGLRPLRRS